ncbi:phosphoenolpyruvate carboxylase [Escherichia coli]
MNEQYSALRSNVSMLGKVLGETIKDALGEHILERVETIRKLSKSSRAGNDANRQELLTTLQNLSNDELLPVARAFSQFLTRQHRRAIPQHFAERRSCQQPGSDRPHPA